MKELQLAELRSSWPAWLGVSIGFIIINVCLALSALAELSGIKAVSSGLIIAENSAAVTITPVTNTIVCMIVGATIIGASTSLVVEARRGSLARLALAGATPRQVINTIMFQLTIVTLICAIIGDCIAYILLQPTLNALTSDPAENLPHVVAVYAVWPLLIANLTSVGLALLAGYKQARHASQIQPVEALRQSVGSTTEKMTVGRWIGAVIWLLIIIIAFGSIAALTEMRTKETFSNIFITSIGVLIASAVFLSRIAPLIVNPLTRSWTALVPTKSPIWHLARNNTLAKGARFTKLVIPVMMTIGLLLGIVAMGETMQASIYANGYNVQLSGSGLSAALTFLTAPLIVALSGAVGSLIMMSKQRDAELALSGIVGTTPAQRAIMPVFEAIIITVTGTLLGTIMMVTMVIFLSIGIPAAQFIFSFTPPYLVFLITVLMCFAVTIAATLLPTLRSLRRPEPEVIARLIAD